MSSADNTTSSGDEDSDTTMATRVLGKVEEYNSKKEEWPQYVECLGHFFVANRIEDANKKWSVFLTVIGPQTYKLLRSLVHPNKPGDKTYEELSDAITAHFKPTPSEIVQRFRFHTRSRRQGAKYVSGLRSLAEFCNFGTTLEAMLRDRIVCVINHDKIQNRLLSETTLTYQRAMDLAQSLETAAQNLRELQKTGFRSEHSREEPMLTDKPTVVSKVESGVESGDRKVTCYRCGKEGHIASLRKQYVIIVANKDI